MKDGETTRDPDSPTTPWNSWPRLWERDTLEAECLVADVMEPEIELAAVSEGLPRA